MKNYFTLYLSFRGRGLPYNQHPLHKACIGWVHQAMYAQTTLT